MRLLVLSDLHVEHAPFVPSAPRGAYDVAVLAGDIGQATLALAWARRSFPDVPIVQVAGNHEFFDTVREDALAAMRAAARRHGVHLLEEDAVAIDGVEFVGCTVWTDYRLHERGGRPVAMSAAGLARRVLPGVASPGSQPMIAGRLARITAPAATTPMPITSARSQWRFRRRIGRSFMVVIRSHALTRFGLALCPDQRERTWAGG